MKKIILVPLMFLIVSTMSCASPKEEEKEILETIVLFSKAGDNNDIDKLSLYLDDNYRVVMNRLFGSKEVSVLSRSAYLEKVKNKEFGGDDRTVTVENVVINGNTASTKVTFKGKRATFTSIIVLVKTKEGKWKLISDTPFFG